MKHFLPDLRELKFKAIKSRGPGGQNVNKVSSAAQMTWFIADSESFSDLQKQLLHEKLSHLINLQGELFLRSDEFRDLERNKQRCIEKLEAHIRQALHQAKPRKKTRPTRSSQIKRVDNKKQRGALKQGRKKLWG